MILLFSFHNNPLLRGEKGDKNPSLASATCWESLRLEGKWWRCGTEAQGPTNQTMSHFSAGHTVLCLHQGLAMCFMVGAGDGGGVLRSGKAVQENPCAPVGFSSP